VVFCPVGYCKVTFPVEVMPLVLPALKFTFRLFEQANTVVPVTLFTMKVEVPEIVKVTGFTTMLAVDVSMFSCPMPASVPSSSTPPEVHFEKVMAKLAPTVSFVPELDTRLAVPVVPTVPASGQGWDTFTGSEVAVEFVPSEKTCGRT
jgi:hypothetical protein